MPERLTPASHPARDLETALRRLGPQVEVSPRPNYAALVALRLQADPPKRVARSDPARRPRVTRPLAVALALVVVVGVVLGVPRTRHAVADLFGLAGVQVHQLPPNGPAPRTTLDAALDLGSPATLDEARQRLSFPVALSGAELGAPDAVYVRREPGLQSLNLVFRPGPGFPPAPDTHVGLLLSEYAGSATPYFDKYLEQGIEVEQVVVGGRWRGLYFPGVQAVLVRDPSGVIHDVYPRLSAPSLVWVKGPVTVRLEANVSRTRALEIAASLR